MTIFFINNKSNNIETVHIGEIFILSEQFKAIVPSYLRNNNKKKTSFHLVTLQHKGKHIKSCSQLAKNHIFRQKR